VDSEFRQDQQKLQDFSDNRSLINGRRPPESLNPHFLDLHQTEIFEPSSIIAQYMEHNPEGKNVILL
jgi:hypothetical protein